MCAPFGSSRNLAGCHKSAPRISFAADIAGSSPVVPAYSINLRTFCCPLLHFSVSATMHIVCEEISEENTSLSEASRVSYT